MFLLNLDYLTELSKLGLKSKQGNLHFFTKFGPPQRKCSHISAKGVGGGWIKKQSSAARTWQQFTFVLSISMKTDFPVSFAAWHAFPCKTIWMVVSFIFSFIFGFAPHRNSYWIMRHSDLTAVAHLLVVSTKGYIRCPKKNSLFDI